MNLSPIVLALALLGMCGNLQAARAPRKGTHRTHRAVAAKSAPPKVKSGVKSSHRSDLSLDTLPSSPGISPTSWTHMERMLPANPSKAAPEQRMGPSTGAPLDEIRPVLHLDTALAAMPMTGAPALASSLLNKAKGYLGAPYHYGGTTPKGFDCSGFVRFVFGSFGFDLDRSSVSMATQGDSVALGQIQPGDLLFFRTRGRRSTISHVGIYLGEGQFIHAASRGGSRQRGVKISELDSSYYAGRLVSSRRILTQATGVADLPHPSAAPRLNAAR